MKQMKFEELEVGDKFKIKVSFEEILIKTQNGDYDNAESFAHIGKCFDIPENRYIWKVED